MIFLSLWNYINGYVIILVEGYFLERFINICSHKKIFLWDIKRHGDLSMVLKITVKGFKMLRPISRKSRCRVRIIQKKGLPFIFNKYKRRKAFFSGIVIFVVFINILASFIWEIEISGNIDVRTADILQELTILGVESGTLKYRIDVDEIAKSMVLQMDKLSWVSFEIKGTKAKISVAERRMPPPLIPENVPCNIVAKKEGMIDSIVVKAGREMVKEGDTVTIGQLLVSGVVVHEVEPKEEELEKLVHSQAEIKARTWYETAGTANINTVETVRTGNSFPVYTLILFDKKIELLINKELNFENYDKIETKKILQIGNNLVLPFGVLIEKYYENKLVDKKLSNDQAKINAKESAIKKLMKTISQDAEIVNMYVDYVLREGESVTANLIFECIEDIGKTEEIGGK